MPSYEHKRLAEEIAKLDAPPSEAVGFATWIKAGGHLQFLRENANADEVVIYGSGEYTFIHTIPIPNGRLSPIDQEDLLGWNCVLVDRHLRFRG